MMNLLSAWCLQDLPGAVGDILSWGFTSAGNGVGSVLSPRVSVLESGWTWLKVARSANRERGWAGLYGMTVMAQGGRDVLQSKLFLAGFLLQAGLFHPRMLLFLFICRMK